MRSTQPERYSRSPEQHDISMQIRGHKRPLMEKCWQPRLWTLLTASIWTCGKLRSDQRASRYGPLNTYLQTSLKSDRLSSEAVSGILSLFLRNPMNTKVGYNFMPHNLDT
jgi:hypothetical protein